MKIIYLQSTAIRTIIIILLCWWFIYLALKGNVPHLHKGIVKTFSNLEAIRSASIYLLTSKLPVFKDCYKYNNERMGEWETELFQTVDSVSIIKINPGQTAEPWIQSWSPLWVTGTQRLELLLSVAVGAHQ